MFKCIACEKPLIPEKVYDYHQCKDCKSYNYISDKPAEEENRIYFNKHFSLLEQIPENKDKKAMYADFLEYDGAKLNSMYVKFNEIQMMVKELLKFPGTLLEIGFGQGERLHNFLESGLDAYGIDISDVAFKKFAKKYPQYRDRVFKGYKADFQVNLVYCSALFEHLDTPRDFLKNVTHYLTDGGTLILDAFPILNEDNPQLATHEDINFWKPCHRVIYSVTGLINLLQEFGFNPIGLGGIDDYNYRVLSMHLKRGFSKVVDLRNAFLIHSDLPDIGQFYDICEKALDLSSLALRGVAVFKKY